ncbi:MAG TPA: endonuclease NucS domain-containing protein [Anaerolineae bacterium]|nr:endonuclease NucS domain-containing protein [Anaerolineae bacterium]
MSLDDVLESHLEQYIAQNFQRLFPGWRIHSLDLSTEKPQKRTANIGVRLRTLAGEIDMLCIDSAGDFVVIELKRNRAPDTVVAQIDRYIAWVENNLAQPNQNVRGVIIAKSQNQHLIHTLAKRPEIELWTYQWLIELNRDATKRVSEEVSTKSNEGDYQTVDRALT